MPRRHPVQREKDLGEIAHRYLNLHEPQAVIAAALNVDQSTVSNDLKVLVKRWQKSALMNVDEHRAAELARINRLELEYWEAWEASKLDKKSTVAERITAADTRLKAIQRSEAQTGDPRFLAGIERCVERRCKLLGLDAPTKVAPTDPTGTREYDNLTNEERITQLGEIFDAVRTRQGSDTSGRDGTGGLVA